MNFHDWTDNEIAAYAHLSRLVDAIKAAEPHVEALHGRIINHECEAARRRLTTLVAATEEVLDTVTQQDFLLIERYMEHDNPCLCEPCITDGRPT
jgi:hypothetical protein